MEFWDIVKQWIYNLFGINNLTTPQGILNCVCSCFTLLIGIFVAYRFVFTIIGVFAKDKKYVSSSIKKKYCFVICARNEEKVIANAIDSIHKQNYPRDLIEIIVVADNCNDQTAEIAKRLGCVVYQRRDLTKQRKGYALEYLFADLKKRNLIKKYDGYIFLDADNVIDKNFVTKMNDAFCTNKYDVITAFRNIKNFQDNVITSAYGFNFYRFIISCHRPRAFFGSGTTGAGTGFLVSADMLKDGWHYHSILEDSEFVTRETANNKRFGFCAEAVCYDEQPTNFFISLRQRLRWSKGAIIVYFKYSWSLLKSFFKKPTWTKYDLYWDCFPYPFVIFMVSLIYQIVSLSLFLGQGATNTSYDWSSFATFLITNAISICIASWFLSIVISIRERKNIYCSTPKLILYNIVWPWFDLLSIPLSFVSLFVHIKWKRIPHLDHRSINDVENDRKR